MSLSTDKLIEHLFKSQQANTAFILQKLERIESMALTQADLDGFKAQIESYTADEKARDEKIQNGLQSVINDVHAQLNQGNLDGTGIASSLAALMQEHADSKPKEDDLLAQVDALKASAPVEPTTPDSGTTVTTTVPDTSTPATPVNQETGLPPATTPVETPVETQPATPALPEQDPSVTPEQAQPAQNGDVQAGTVENG